MEKLKYVLAMLLAIGIALPAAYLVTGLMTDTGGMIQVATNATAAASVAGGTLNADWELAIWKLWPWILLIMCLVLIVYAIAKKDIQIRKD